jgi:hypothetical protein
LHDVRAPGGRRAGDSFRPQTKHEVCSSHFVTSANVKFSRASNCWAKLGTLARIFSPPKLHVLSEVLRDNYTSHLSLRRKLDYISGCQWRIIGGNVVADA